MALLGTHIRFALDIKDDFDVQNLDKYISGTVYPDSRYITKIDRNITHNKDLIDKNFYQKDDFRKGWITHLIYDLIQFNVFKEIFPELFVNFKNEKGKVSLENWVLRTGLKILQDMNDIKKFPIKNYLKSLEYTETPNGEKTELIKEYNQMFVDIYQKEKIVIEDLVDMWIKFGIEKEITDKIRNKTIELSLDKNILEKISLIYPETVKKYKKENKI